MEQSAFPGVCPLSSSGRHAQVLLAHGGGGTLMNDLIADLFLTTFDNAHLRSRQDAAVLQIDTRRIAFTTDSYVVRPLEFPGGDIGSLAVHGTINDLATAGARPLWLSVGFIIEEGFPIETLRRLTASMQSAAREAGVQVVTGDTKVVDRGRGDGLYVNTAGIGVIEHDLDISPKSIRPGDAILLSGDLGRHGIAVMAAREGLEFEGGIASDSAPLAGMVLGLIKAGVEIRGIRDVTRGGLASALNELAQTARLTFHIHESSVPVREEVQGACELLGLDPLYVACEGRMIIFVPQEQAERTLRELQRSPDGFAAAQIGQVSSIADAPVILKSRIGVARILEMLSGEQLPRIC